MKTLIGAFSAQAEQPDLFAYWQEELQLRRGLRQTDSWQEVQIGTRAEYEFLQRGLYYGPQRDIFFAILLNNLADQSVLAHLRDSDPGVVTGFLDYMALYINKEHPPAASLGFLIHLFQDGYRSQYTRLLEALDAEQCAYLMARTGNRGLRRMLKEQLERIKDDNTECTADQLVPERISHPWPTIHGDKIELLAAAAMVLKPKRDTRHDNGVSRRDNLVEGAELLLRAGLLADCIALLNRMLLDQDLERSNDNAAGSHPWRRQIIRLLDRTMPLLGMLAAPLHPRGWVLDNYRCLFPGFSPEPGSLLYLDLYAIVAAAMQGRRQYAKYEIIQKAGQLQLLRQDDPLAAALVQWDRTGILENPQTVTVIEGLAAKIKSQPHEALAGLELLRYLHIHGSKPLDKPNATRMLKMYLQLFNWLPHAVFINDPLVRHLGPQSDEALRDEAEKILAAQQIDRDYEAPGIPSSGITDKIEPVMKKKLRLSRAMGVF